EVLSAEPHAYVLILERALPESPQLEAETCSGTDDLHVAARQIAQKFGEAARWGQPRRVRRAGLEPRQRCTVAWTPTKWSVYPRQPRRARSALPGAAPLTDSS